MIGVAGGTRQVVIAQRVLVVSAGGSANLLEHRRREDFTAEDCGDLLCLDLIDERSDLGWCGVREVLGLHSPDDVPAEVLGEVRVGIVVRQQFLIARGDGGLVLAQSVCERGRLSREGVVIGRVGRRIGRVDLAQRVTNDRRVLDGIQRVGPQVGVGFALFLGEGEVVDVVRLRQHRGADLDDGGGLLLVGLGEFNRGVLELEPVDEDDVGLAQQLGHLRCGLIGVAVGALRNDALDLRLVARDLGGDRGDGRNGGGNEEGPGGRGDRRARRARRTRRASAEDERGAQAQRHDGQGSLTSEHDPIL